MTLERKTRKEDVLLEVVLGCTSCREGSRPLQLGEQVAKHWGWTQLQGLPTQHSTFLDGFPEGVEAR